MKAPCPFCPPHLRVDKIVLENGLCYFLQEAVPSGVVPPVLFGAGLIIPKAHRETVFDLTEAEWRATYALLQGARELLDRLVAPQGYNVGWNVGSTGGQEVFHAHLHVIPRHADEPYAGRGIRYWLKQEENRRRA
jgi:diadenosine tetraphosphate (Ap4A) HIT family hydrolase